MWTIQKFLAGHSQLYQLERLQSYKAGCVEFSSHFCLLINFCLSLSWPANGGLSHPGEFWECKNDPQQQLQSLWQVPPHPHSPVSQKAAIYRNICWCFTKIVCSIVAPQRHWLKLFCQLSLIPVDSGVVVGTSLSKYLLEKSRVVFQVRTLNELCCVLETDIMEEYMMFDFLGRKNSWSGQKRLQYCGKNNTSHWLCNRTHGLGCLTICQCVNCCNVLLAYCLYNFFL